MLRLRVMGLPEEIQQLIEELDRQFAVLDVSHEYQCKGKKEYVRKYVALTIPETNRTE